MGRRPTRCCGSRCQRRERGGSFGRWLMEGPARYALDEPETWGTRLCRPSGTRGAGGAHRDLRDQSGSSGDAVPVTIWRRTILVQADFCR